MVTAGIGPHNHVHIAVAVRAEGRPIGKPLTVKNDAVLIITLLKWIRSITDGTATWAIEDGRGFARRLADGLLLAGQEVAWVAARLAAAHRKLHAAAGAKSDPAGATAAARAAIAAPGPGRHRIDDHVRELRVLAGYRAGIIKRRAMVINQLKAQPHIWPGHTPADLTRAKNLAISAALTSTAQLSPHVRRALASMTAEIAGLNRQVRDLDTTIRQIVSPLAPALLQITGISYNCAAVLIAETGGITRFSSPARLARYTGRAPIPLCSPGKQRHRLHRAGNRRLNSVLCTAAIVQKRFHPPAQQLLARHQPAKGPRSARRILQRHLIDVIHHAMTTGQATWQHPITRHQFAA